MIYVMTDEKFGQEIFLTSWEDFEEECQALGWDPGEANLTELDDFLAQTKPTPQLISQFFADAIKYKGVQARLEDWVRSNK